MSTTAPCGAPSRSTSRTIRTGTARPTTTCATPMRAERRLRFDSPPDLEPGTRLKVWGLPETRQLDDGLRVTSFERLATAAPITSALVAAAPFSPRSFAFVLVDIGGGVNVTPTPMMGRLINNADSIRNYYLGDSYGMQDMTAEVFGPISYTLTDCGNGHQHPGAQPAADGAGDVPALPLVLRQPDLALRLERSRVAGDAGQPSRDTWYNGSTSCVVLVQEPGHNFGMQHSSSISCPDGAFADDPNSCTASEYGDLFDPMGGGCRHMNAWQKAYQGWFGGCNGVKVTSSGTFTLLPFEQSCDGVQFLQIKAPKTRPFMRPAGGGGRHLPRRSPTTMSSCARRRTSTGCSATARPFRRRSLIHVADDLHSRTQRGVHTYLLDMTPTTTGRTRVHRRRAGVRQDVLGSGGRAQHHGRRRPSADAGDHRRRHAGSGRRGPTCLDGTAFSPPGPGPGVVRSRARPVGAGGTAAPPAGTAAPGLRRIPRAGPSGQGGDGEPGPTRGVQRLRLQRPPPPPPRRSPSRSSSSSPPHCADRVDGRRASPAGAHRRLRTFADVDNRAGLNRLEAEALGPRDELVALGAGVQVQLVGGGALDLVEQRRGRRRAAGTATRGRSAPGRRPATGRPPAPRSSSRSG